MIETKPQEMVRLRLRVAELEEKARLFLMWFERDGTPVDGFRFREQYAELSEAVEYEKWHSSLLPGRKPKRRKKR